MECEPSELHVTMEDSDNKSSFDDSLLNELPSMSDEDTEKQGHVPYTDYQDSDPIPTLPPMINVNNVSNPEDLEGSIPHSNMQNLWSYLQKQCYNGYKWTSPLTFEGSLDKRTFQEMDVLQFIGDPKCKDKKGNNAYRVYFNPSKYPVTDLLSKIASLPDNASLKVQTQT